MCSFIYYTFNYLLNHVFISVLVNWFTLLYNVYSLIYLFFVYLSIKLQENAVKRIKRRINWWTTDEKYSKNARIGDLIMSG